MSGMLLGDVALQGFEVPEEILFGGRQALALHRLPGGGLIADAMGPEAGDVAWSGAMIGPDASERARRLDALRESGETAPLLFGDMAFDVVVREFTAAYRRESWIGRYRIRCLVLPDRAPVAEGAFEMAASALAAALALDPSGIVTAGGTLSSAFGTSSAAFGAAEAGTLAIQTAVAGRGGAIGGASGLAAAAGQAELLAKSGAMSGVLGAALAMEDT